MPWQTLAMATAKMKIILPLVVWIWLHTVTTVQSYDRIGHGKREVFFLNLEDGYFGCQVNESTDVLQLFEISKLCDGRPNCYLGSDERRQELKCTDNCQKEDGSICQNGACLDGQCHCNDGYGGCNCEVPDENECKYRPCDVFAHCTNTLGSFSCTCYPGYQGDGFHCEDINECEDPNIAARCVQNAWCCNLPAHFLCKCNPGFQGDGEVQCVDIDECANPNACGQNAICQNYPGNYTCVCPEGFYGNPYDGCVDVDECDIPNACAPGAHCANVIGGRQCTCPPGYEGDPYNTGCADIDECSRTNPCGRDAICSNLEGSFRCACPPGFIGDPLTGCTEAECNTDLECSNEKACINFQCIDPCTLRGACGLNALCKTIMHRPRCSCPECYVGMANTQCNPDPKCLETHPRPSVPIVCNSDKDCGQNVTCNIATGECIDPCSNPSFKCRGNKKCEVHNHRPTCVCKNGFVVNERGEISCAPERTECSTNEHCPSNKSCIEGICQNPCNAATPPCPPEKGCDVLNHKPVCICLKNCVPTLSICLRDNGCPRHQACRAFRCEDPCATANCPENSPCTVEDHKPICEFCPEGFIRDSKYGCLKDIQCRSHSECSAQQACIGGKCNNPCLVSNPCQKSQDCQVQDHQPVCVKVCQCRKHSDCGRTNYVCDGCNCVLHEEPGKTTGCEHCPPGVACDPTTGACIREPGQPKKPKPCESDMDCLESEACYMSVCQDPCEFTKACASTAKCQAKMHRPICTCPKGYEGNPAVKCFESETIRCTVNEECPVTEACINFSCQRPCDVRNPCAHNAICINTNHGSDCSCAEGYQGNGYVGCVAVPDYKPICQYNEDCPPNKLCDRLNRICINPCFEDSCGDNAECLPKDHGTECRCLPGYAGNPFIACDKIYGCRQDEDCSSNEACINGQCSSPCQCGTNAICEVLYHKANCKCPPGYVGNPAVVCQPPTNPCDPNPCGTFALCELDNGNPICYCPKGLTGNPFKNCIPEGDECSPNPCGPNSGCRVVGGKAVCFCLPEYEGTPPQIPCDLPKNPCDPSPCGPNTQCSILSNGFAKCTCLPGYLESPNTVRGCIEQKNPCEPNPCGFGAQCDPFREPACFCPVGLVGNPFKSCGEPVITPILCSPGPCGLNADCYVSGNQEQCYCKPGFMGDPYYGCRIEPPTPCSPNPCGPGAQCIVTPAGNSLCRCPDGFGGDPTGTGGCHGYECVVDENCGEHQACMGYRCRDPCPGACGVNADCRVEKHHPVCTCRHEYTGNPVINCFKVSVMPENDPCMPNPCGINTICQNIRGRAVCTCLPDFKGDPQFGCQPECILNTDCPLTQACLNRRCTDPCLGALCGQNAQCQVRDHTASCVCLDGYMGDPLYQCQRTPPVTIPSTNISTPCLPSPCGPGIECTVYGPEVAICNPCLRPDAAYDPQCRPECLTNSDCPFDKACLGYTCQDPCLGSCGVHAVCHVVTHTPICTCPPGLQGNPFEHCTVPMKPEDRTETCDSFMCGANAVCTQKKGGITCTCRQGFFGNPWISCRPECVINTDCSLNQACINNKCVDPCNGVCGIGAKCEVSNHVPICICSPGQAGDPFVSCHVQKPIQPSGNPCDPSPCGPFSRCLLSPQGYATCSCLPNYLGAPPACKPECIATSECPQTKACSNRKCVDPCIGACGKDALCNVINHNPICSCPPGQHGDPFVNCYTPRQPDIPRTNPCVPSPCGPNSICQVKEDRPVCSCVAEYVGSPPNCRPECVINQECPRDKACVKEKCVNPCLNSCGRNARCNIVNHVPFCTCVEGYEGDAFVECSRIPMPMPKDPCNPSPCGINAQCTSSEGVARCSCITPYIGNPYAGGCRPECTMDSDCSSNLACLAQHCRDPCQGRCGTNAECYVVNHVPVCSCAKGYIGDPFTSCRPAPPPIPENPCEPSPCGPNSVCQLIHNQAVCSCQPDFFGSPPNCKPECLISSECALNKACVNQKCVDPCPGTCGRNAKCLVKSHNPICSCPPNYFGDPFVLCEKETREVPPMTPCVPSPCGPNSECRNIQNRAVCSCLPGMYGAPPNCRPECVINQDCPSHLACLNNKCKDPCVGSCGFNAQCAVRNHNPICTCIAGFKGDPFSGCNPIEFVAQPTHPCNPSPCGPNAVCKEHNNIGSCSCLPEYFGDPYTGCRPECLMSTDCPHNQACFNMKCKDPCPGSCGVNAECSVINHNPQCYCPNGFTGNALTFCRKVELIEEPRRNPCVPSPCGQYSICRVQNDRPVCSCDVGYIGAPPACKPECMISAECSMDKACKNQKCIDPCLGTCGYNAHCKVIMHNPICSCPSGYIGDPFSRCYLQPKIPDVEKNPCIPSPCGSFSECRIQNKRPVCSCLPNYFGRPPNCRPECTVSSECDPMKACQNQRCIDPCVGSCGINSECKAINHVPVCFCLPQFTGDPFVGCQDLPPVEEERHPCNPSPCGANAVCREQNGVGSCTCLPEYFGDPYAGCRPECVTNSDCTMDKACFNNKCTDPCSGSCGLNAECKVYNHAPNCYCLPGYTGNALVSCHVIQPIVVETDPCQPSPCGPYSECRVINGHAVCSCQQNYIGAPPACRPECTVSSECPQDRACIGQKCKDPCPGTCSPNARCKVINHNPICSCPPSYTGDPFQLCIEERKPLPIPPSDACLPSPCGPNSQCRNINGRSVCSCLPDFIGRAPNCRPECTLNTECPGNLACVRDKCRDPCPGSCGTNSNCRVVQHSPICQCNIGFTGDPFVGCTQQPIVEEEPHPCNPSPCGANAVCTERNGVGSCTCLPEYFGDPYTSCRPECVLNNDCAKDKTCVNMKCKDPCPGTCGLNADCRVFNHAPSCYCIEGYTGNPTVACHIIQPVVEEKDPCQPSPCGPYSQCRVVSGHAVCSCDINYIGSPPNCRPECMISADCPMELACINQKCQEPCKGSCGVNSRCQVVNHNPICSCAPGFTGDPFVRCQQEDRKPPPPENVCIPSPCGPNARCREIGNIPTCSCLPGYIGRPPNCRPECTINAECSSTLACQNEKCIDPCPGSCGINADCQVINHRSVCSCRVGYTGDPFGGCSLVPIIQPTPEPRNPCNPSPCGANAVCRERNGIGSCTCMQEYFGDPYTSCRPECVTNTDCSRNKACVNNKCIDPCPGTCGLNAECVVSNHAPVCNCLPGYTGNPVSSCHLPQPIVHDHVNPCQPSPCGPYSVCKVINEHAVCSCQANYVGSPPACRPECMVSSECPQDRACLKNKCQDPCVGTCGINARCNTINHNPICTCPSGFIGDPFVQCIREITTTPRPSENPCVPSPCGPNSQCRNVAGQAACSCLPNYIGRAPNCRPECTINAECLNNLACQNERCVDPCPGSCGSFTNCIVVNHAPNCQCLVGYTGDPFTGCSQIPPSPPTTERPRNPCDPSPCGANAVCKVQGTAGSCICLPEYTGDPYTGCRPECVTNTDCDRSRACVNNKCIDPCPGTCGINAECRVLNHAPSCTCITGYTGDPARLCYVLKPEKKPTFPCQPSPCGPYSQCRAINDQAVCSCSQGYIGTPPMCRPECIISSECPQNLACKNQKCIDPCPGTCGLNANCRVINHNPICGCLPGYTGDPFTSCSLIPQTTPPPRRVACEPSPCGPNSQCRIVGDQPACSCLPNYIGRPPNCRPECINDLECPNHLACKNEKCRDPCPGSCGNNAQCTVVNHKPVCSCLPGYIGDPISNCRIAPPPSTEGPPPSPCYPSPCGPNAECRERNGAGACSCARGFFGNPYDKDLGCHRECERNKDCAQQLACVSYKCVDPCPGTCGLLAQCSVANHIPTCTCLEGFTGDPFSQCTEISRKPEPVPEDPCLRSPCGPNSQCRNVNNQPVCSCLPNYIGSPPNCRPECVVSSECPEDRACINNKCADPCPNTCGISAQCTTKYHNPICACPPGYSGDPFTRCAPQPIEEEPTERPPSCTPSPCGPNSQCRLIGGNPSCSCLPEYIGMPPNCRPECILSSECTSQLACIKQKCRDPCPGSCGVNAKCTILNHTPICTCEDGYEGDPFTLCSMKPAVTVSPPRSDPCNPSPCGPNARCDNGICTCLPEYQGNPYESCRPECVLSTECTRDKACIRNKCVDPCPGVCGQNAKCDVINHIPTCSCPDGLTGDPFTLCRTAPKPPERRDPCNPSPCGPNSQCRNINNNAVCSCIFGYFGAPPNCKPECLVSAECAPTRSCINQKCIDPCLGSCGIGARCEVINHSPICSCPEGQTGDPFSSCREVRISPTPPPVINPCEPSPCGPNSICRVIGDQGSCSCVQGYIGNPPSCRPECVINPDCQANLACINNKCTDPCPGSCGENTVCKVIAQSVSCSCSPGYTGNPFIQCIVQPKDERINPCEPSPCGTNAECKQKDGVGSCTCIAGYQGNPYESCKPECVLSSDCPTNKACNRNKCVDPCPGVCGNNADCAVVNHIPTCTCATGYEGDPFRECQIPLPRPTEPTVFDPCQPTPCGPNSQCRNINGQGVCSCLPEFIGSPPNCKPECVVSSECSPNQACHNFKCANPCAGSCGLGARCEVINHNPICSCPSGLTGDPFVRCREIPPEPKPRPNLNPCVPSPCGPNSECRVIAEQASCSCLANYFGPPPNCRPECIVNTDCPSTKACISEKCRDPCVGSCGFNTDCRVQNHIPICTCIENFVGDPFTQCQPKHVEPVVPEDPCSPNPCGPNAQCDNGVCTCLPLYNGDPYRGCRPECTMNTDCSPNKACSNSKCIDPCPGTCGQNAECSVINHIPTCSCPARFEGDPFTACRLAIPVVLKNPCEPSPCGPNSVCRVNNEVAVCSCQPGLIGSPPSCRPECVVSAECPLQQACLNNKCIDPCPGTCGINAKCQVVNHNPICSCASDLTGDPFSRCYPRPVQPQPPINPCLPSPCGPNALCQVRGESPACSCLENYVGVPPNCRPECTINPECPSDLSCINQRCRDPCAGSCGPNALCNVVNHNPVCACVQGYTGDPFRGCSMQLEPTPPPKEIHPCQPSPCGPNAVCRVVNNYAVCECIPEYRGNPYESCRPECLSNSDCTMNRACIRNKCQDPCPGTCGINAMCSVLNHVPICSCPDGFTGDAFRLCTEVIVPPPRDPCNPSPCGINTVCKTLGENAVCECLPGFFGNPTSGGCRPECTISADCSRDKACVNSKCIDPCVGVCGFNAQCHVVNHSPICSCPPPLIGNPFELCIEQKEPADPCNPTPCGPNGQCRVINGVASCSYPECIINQDCPRDKACYSQKCGDPCRDACGVNALCQVINHKAVCTCPPEYIGSPEVQCRLEPRVPQPKIECLQDSDCTNDKACIDNRCQDPCSVSQGVCGRNAECRSQLHRAICICRDGYTGNAQTACFEIGCRSNSDCPPTQACINKECIDPCSYTSCGLNALCKPDSNHRARCYCPENFRGDPFIRCERPECTNDNECPYNLACRNERCEDPCKCGLSAICSVNNHRPQCACPPGYIGNPLLSCNIRSDVLNECKMDADCPSKLACFSGKCKNPCSETKPCGINAECVVVDTLPLRTMSCICLPGYIGDADKECRLEIEEGCKNHNDCAFTEACLNRRCVNPCAVGSTCAVTALCDPQNHKAVCRCPSGFLGNPFVKCYEGLIPKEECTTSLDCPNDKSCIHQHCQDPCLISNPCGTDAQCKTLQHHPTCSCPEGWGGNPQVMCYKPECKSNEECPYNKACINENCLNPCGSLICGRGAQCIVQNHRAQCTCPAGTQGVPEISCIAGICQYNEDCGDHEACDRLNRVCRPVCQDDTCADTAICEAEVHQPKCRCPPGTEGNPYQQCVVGKTPQPRPECKMDIDCPSQYACIEQRCLNPCLENNVCTPDQECRVLDTLPLRTIMCQCPPDTIADISGRCRAISVEPQCKVDSDCTDREKCISGNCLEACKIDLCGINALCNSQYHQAICSCSPGYTGNPHIECTVSRVPLPKPVPECYSDDECTYDKACHNERCINPCLKDRPCGVGAFCSVNNHKAVCTCPIGFEGSPHTECLPPIGPSVGCTSNSECAQTESCVNGICVNPCNCGPNSQCNIVNHYPLCFCKPGYSGNPQVGCIKLGCQNDNECNNDQQCYNGQCVDPCILGDPCATSAICYGNNHIASCKCPPGYEGNPFDRCERIECHTDSECPYNRACIQKHCVDPCSTIANPPCAHNAICYAQNHAAGCQCPPHLPEGNPLAYCSAPVIVGKECELDLDCPSQLACIQEKCVNPCKTLSPCHSSAHCSVLDTIPVRTMICTCPEGWVPNENGECHAVVVPIPPGCTSDNDCSSNEACINRRCRNPCDCGTNANCLVQNHRPICSCKNGYEGNPNIACHAVGCRIDSECESGKACVNGNCVNPCLVEDPCGINAECHVYQNRAQCRCLSGYRGNPFERCNIVGCISNSDCPGDRQCRNTQCVDPCLYDSPCSPRAECKVQNHVALCRCRNGFIGNPYVDCKPEPQPECREDVECPSRLACLNNKCQDPCIVLEPCHRPSECVVVGSVPVRTMICVCPPGYISSGSGTCHPVKVIAEVGACVVDDECPADKSCINGICRNPCNCGVNAECRIKNHKPVCTCKQGYDGNPEIECERTGCRNDEECSGQHICVNRQCVPVCAADGSSCGKDAICYGVNHHAVCDCPPGFIGNPEISCVLIGCRSDTECPSGRACVNNKCDNPCESSNPCAAPAECKVYNHQVECVCPPGTVSDGKTGCIEVGIEKCRKDHDCPSQYACIGGECINPCKETDPCGVNAECTVLDTEPVRTMICKCMPGYEGNAAVQCDKTAVCRIDKGFIRTPDGKCVCPPNTALDENDECIMCPIQKGFKIDEKGRCVCALERGFIIDDRGNCVCPINGYHLDARGNCIKQVGPKCETDDDCLDQEFCESNTKTCQDPCSFKSCAENAFCNATNHVAVCKCRVGFTGDPEVYCNQTSPLRTVFPRPEMVVSCLSDGVQVEIHIAETEFNGVFYVKGHSKDEQCRRIVTLPSNSLPRTEIFKVQFGNCGLIHVNGQASFVLVIQKHPKLVTYKAQAYHIKCVYQTGEQNVTLGFNVSMLTTAGTIANTGPPPVCTMKIVTPTGQEINSAEIGDNLMLQVEVQPGSIYGGFARSCVAKTMEANVENEYPVTDENGCATDPTIFGEWDYSPDTQSLTASFNAFKFPSSDNIRFQCNIRVCFGACQPVNCRGYNAFGRRKRSIENENTDLAVSGDLMTGQLREEITISSNAILTFERREEKLVDPAAAADYQRVEDICVSMIGFIISLVITALLALVAIAVAVSCWLMAYRRRPKASGPLPHPPEFPNPLFTTPEPMAEPSPDYLT